MLHWLCNSPTPYNNVLFSAIEQTIGSQLLVHYLDVKETPHCSLLAENTSYRWRVIRSRAFDEALFRAAFNPTSRFIIGGWSYPVYQQVMALARRRYAIWTDIPHPGRRAFPKDLLRSVVLRFAFSGAKKILVTGEPGIEKIVQLGGDRNRMINFPYWIEVPDETPPLPDQDGPLHLMAIGRLIPLKGYQQLIPVTEALHQERVDFRLSIVGDGPQRADLERKFNATSYRERIIFHGWKSGEEIQQLISTSHLLLHPARWEPYGVVVLEAMAQGRPVIASTTTMAAVDRIHPGVNGALFDVDNTDDFVRTVLGTVKDRSRLAEMGRQAYLTAGRWPVGRAVPLVQNLFR